MRPNRLPHRAKTLSDRPSYIGEAGIGRSDAPRQAGRRRRVETVFAEKDLDQAQGRWRALAETLRDRFRDVAGLT
jgi:hypothetical protein